MVKEHLQIKLIGGRIYVEREALEKLLSNPCVLELNTKRDS